MYWENEPNKIHIDAIIKATRELLIEWVYTYDIDYDSDYQVSNIYKLSFEHDGCLVNINLTCYTGHWQESCSDEEYVEEPLSERTFLRGYGSCGIEGATKEKVVELYQILKEIVDERNSILLQKNKRWIEKNLQQGDLYN